LSISLEEFLFMIAFHSLCVLHLVSLDIPADFKKDLQQLMFDLRLECFKVIMDHACLGKLLITFRIVFYSDFHLRRDVSKFCREQIQAPY
jgi:hypothetical protein